uniref:NADH-ubiquinone oxidoreductase chain 4 n=1 Tax=Eurypogon sp. EUR01 TaxID=1205553 RepID=A0A0S2MQV7_9COLE|nr:NADH deshydrogenase subunit 4 [Eurypogon sp. EUR01]
MMKFFLYMIFLIPLCFLNFYWYFSFFFWFLYLCLFFLFGIMNYYCLISFVFGIDFISYVLILLSIWICFLMILSSQSLLNYNFYYNYFLLIILFLLVSLIFLFSSLNLFLFYLFFEISLIPTLILILGWGYQPERLQAGIYMLFYTLIASLPMLISIFYLYNIYWSLDFSFLVGDFFSVFMFFCINLVFFVKIPLYMIHLWLPKAHVEAPISGSMILAGVLLKLGGYGLIRFMVLFLSNGFFLNNFFIVFSIYGGMIVSFICLRQVDLKSLIAYSSVSHMSLVMAGILTLSLWGFSGSLFMMVAHGLCSSGLFCLANFSYERIMSRSIFLNKGFINIMPSMAMWWFLLCSSNMAAPPSLNLIGELFLLSSLIMWNFYLMIILIFLSFFGAVYSLYLYSFTQHGCMFSGMYSFSLNYVREFLLVFLHWFPLNLLFMIGDLFLFY